MSVYVLVSWVAPIVSVSCEENNNAQIGLNWCCNYGGDRSFGFAVFNQMVARKQRFHFSGQGFRRSRTAWNAR